MQDFISRPLSYDPAAVENFLDRIRLQDKKYLNTARLLGILSFARYSHGLGYF